jgi:uncharacterized protein
MKKLFSLLMILSLLMTIPALAEANDDQYLVITGSASVSVQADYAVLSIGVQTSGTNVDSAQLENAATMNVVLEAIKGCGVAEDDIVTSSFNIYDTTSWNESKETAYRVENLLSVTIRELDKAGKIIDVATQAGANILNGISFYSSARNEAYKKALTRAVEDAQDKATVLVTACGKKLGKLVKIETGSDYYSNAGVNNYYTMDTEVASADTSIISGDISVSASVTLTYTFE